jgi:hypothetical protein
MNREKRQQKTKKKGIEAHFPKTILQEAYTTHLIDDE